MRHIWLPLSAAHTLALLLLGQHSTLLTHQQGKTPLLAPVTKPSSYHGAGKGHHHLQPLHIYEICWFLPELLLT